MEVKYISTTRMAKEKGLQTAEMFDTLIQQGLIKPIDGPKKWELTDKGKLLGGKYNENPDFNGHIEWPSNLELDQHQNSDSDLLKPMKNQYSNNQKTADTEGEKYIKEFFREVGLDYEYQSTIRNLSNDIKAHRVADFYLPKYGVYVEFFGHWNTNDTYKENYKIKKRIYHQNNIPCVFIYPENLGFIHFAFDHRIMETLVKNHKEESLSKYKNWKWYNGSRSNIFGLVLCSAFYLIMFLAKEQGKAIILFLFLYNVFKIIKIWYLVYVKGSYSINRMLYD